MNPNAQAALDVEIAGEEEMEEDLDYDALYGGLDVEPTTEAPKELKNGLGRILGDVGKQFTKELLIGAGGAYGDLAELAGLSQEPSELDRAKSYNEFETLSKMKEPGYKPSVYDIASLTDDSEIPSRGRLPTSEKLRDLNELVGGPGEAETPQGRYAARSGKLIGNTAALTPVPQALLGAGAAGLVGQGIEEGGGGPLMQAAGEIITMIGTQGKGIPLQSSRKAIQDKISSLREAGYNEQQITMALNAANRGGKRAKFATKGRSTEEAFEDFATKSDDLVNDILTKEIPGIEKGTQEVHELAQQAYGKVVQDAANVTITKPQAFHQAAKKVTDHLENTLGKNPDAAPFIKRISEAAVDAANYPSAEKMINFYRELNQMGNWADRGTKERLITIVKEGIKDSFKQEGKVGKKLAEDFEKVNKGIQKAYRAEEVHNLIQKTKSGDKIDYNKLYKTFDKLDNVKLYEQVLGPKQARNLQLISKTGKEIKDFDKAWKGAGLASVADIGRGGAFAYYAYKGEWDKAAYALATKAPTAVARRLAEKSLTDPKFQNLIIKGLHAVKNSSPTAIKSANEALKQYVDEDGGIDVE